MCHHEGYHRAMSWEIDVGDAGPRAYREELTYDLPWRVLAALFAALVFTGAALSLVIQLLLR
jgi:hypothetical protein